MNCEQCQPLLIDLVSDELDEARAKAVRGHAAGCERCGADLRVLEEGLQASAALPRLSAPTAVRDFVLAEARRQSEAAALRTDPPPAREDERRGGPGWFSRLAELAMSPQVAMVAVLLLMISVGLYYLPGPEPEHAALSPLRMQEESAEPQDPAASATAVPVEESEEASSEAAEPTPRDAREARARGDGEQAPQPRTKAKKKAEDQTRRRSGGAASKGEAQRRARSARPAKKPAARSAPASQDALFGGPAGEPPPAPAPDTAAESEAQAPAQGLGALGESRAAEGAASSGATNEDDADEGARTLQLARAALARGRHLEAARLAEAALRRGAAPLEAHAVAAEGHRRAGSCTKAAPHYRALRKLKGGLPASWPQAVRCFDALGDVASVESWLALAEREQPAQAARVRASLRAARSKRSVPRAAPAEALEAQ